MSDPTYTPPKIWSFDAENGGKFANINRPTAGARFDKTFLGVNIRFSCILWPHRTV